MVDESKKKTRAGIFQPALRVRVGRGWEFQTRTRPAGNPPRQTRGYAQPVIFPSPLSFLDGADGLVIEPSFNCNHRSLNYGKSN